MRIETIWHGRNMENLLQNKVILCIGECVLDIIQVCDEFPKEDSDLR
jgi:hypothetical protein